MDDCLTFPLLLDGRDVSTALNKFQSDLTRFTKYCGFEVVSQLKYGNLFNTSSIISRSVPSAHLQLFHSFDPHVLALNLTETRHYSPQLVSFFAQSLLGPTSVALVCFLVSLNRVACHQVIGSGIYPLSPTARREQEDPSV
jgi:hypothetical protein